MDLSREVRRLSVWTAVRLTDVSSVPCGQRPVRPHALDQCPQSQPAAFREQWQSSGSILGSHRTQGCLTVTENTLVCCV